MEKISAINVLAQLGEISVPAPTRDSNPREKELSTTIMNLIRKLEEAAISEFIEDDELVQQESEFEENVVETYEPLVGPGGVEFFTLEYIKNEIDFYDSAVEKRSF